MNLSFGDLPVLSPVSVIKAPWFDRKPSPLSTAKSIRDRLSRFQWTLALVTMPLSLRSPEGVPIVPAMIRRPAGRLSPLRYDFPENTPSMG
jgi:hypothetical protein